MFIFRICPYLVQTGSTRDRRQTARDLNYCLNGLVAFKLFWEQNNKQWTIIRKSNYLNTEQLGVLQQIVIIIKSPIHRQRFFVSRKIKKGTGTVRDEILFTCNILRSFYCDLELAKLPKDALKATKKKKKTIAFSYDFFCFSWQIAGHF